jgi:hypothetical protein
VDGGDDDDDGDDGGYFDEEDEQDYFDREQFAEPGGKSALRAATPTNPRNLPCPTCRQPNKLTPRDVALHYQCDECADHAEGGGY